MLDRHQIDKFEELAKPLVKWLNDNGNPHSIIVIETDSAGVYSGETSIPITEFIRD